jgi:hypothetical protein
MQEEVDQPVSYLDYGEEFIPQTALIPRRPWLAPSLPIILPPTLAIYPTRGADPALDDNIYMSDSDSIPDHTNIHQSNDQLILPNSDSSVASELNFPVSDGEDDAMDVVRSDEQDIPMPPANADSGSDSEDIVFPESPVAMRRSNVRAGGMAAIERDPNTGHFTAASFANFPDELLD